MNDLTASSTLPAVYVVKKGFVAQSVGVAYYIWLAATYTELPDSSALTLHCSHVLPHAHFSRMFSSFGSSRLLNL